MQTSPISSRTTKSPALDALMAFLEEREKAHAPVADLGAFEMKMKQMFAAAEAEAVKEEIARFDVDLPTVEIAGVIHRQVLRCEQAYMTAAGEVTIMRSLYSTREDGERAVCPMELRAGIVAGFWTPLAAQQGAWVVAHLTPGEGEVLFERVGAMRPSKSSLDRLVKQLGERWEDDRADFEATLLAKTSVPANAVAVAISLDGAHVPMRGKPKPTAAGEADAAAAAKKRPTEWHEASCGTMSLYDKDGERLSTIRLGRMPERKKATLKQMLATLTAAVLAQRPDLELVKLADGAEDNWRFLSGLDGIELPSGWQVLDFCHAANHLHDALEAAYGKGSACEAQYEKLRHVLRHDEGGAQKVIRALAYLRDKHPRRKIIERELSYFRKNRHRMRYAEMAAKNLPIGTGVTEAACKTLITARMKRSGAVWGEAGGQAVLTLRALAKSDGERFDRAWKLLAGSFVHDVSIPNNLVSLSQWRRR